MKSTIRNSNNLCSFNSSSPLGCDNGTYGNDCNNTCGHCINDESCFHTKGSCLNGCDPGFTGNICQTSRYHKKRKVVLNQYDCNNSMAYFHPKRFFFALLRLAFTPFCVLVCLLFFLYVCVQKIMFIKLFYNSLQVITIL